MLCQIITRANEPAEIPLWFEPLPCNLKEKTHHLYSCKKLNSSFQLSVTDGREKHVHTYLIAYLTCTYLIACDMEKKKRSVLV
jgi:hypothetical protein